MTEREQIYLKAIEAGIAMRSAQRAYFKAEYGTAIKKRLLNDSLMREKYFDRLAENAIILSKEPGKNE